MKTTTHRLITAGLAAISLVTIALMPGVGEAWGSDFHDPCERDGQVRIERLTSTWIDYMDQTGYPDGRPGYAIDYINSLACGGADSVSNLQWLTIEEHWIKTASERKGCP
jgi:hypothetical protein